MLGFGRKGRGEKLDLSLAQMREVLREQIAAAEAAGDKATAAALKAKMVVTAGVGIEKQQPQKLRS